jgi:glucose/arabinose dehydrogenase
VAREHHHPWLSRASLLGSACAVVVMLGGCVARPRAVRERITTPAGIALDVVARGVGQPTSLAFDRAGGLWVASSGVAASGDDGIWYVGLRGAHPRHVVGKLSTALGMTWYRDELYVAYLEPYSRHAPGQHGRVVAFGRFDGTRFRHRRTVLDDLPVGLHTVDGVVPGPDGRLYLGIGSQFDAARSKRALSGTVVSFTPQGTGLRVVARGFRNPYGLAFVPGTRLLLVTDNGRDDLGPDRPPEELNVVPTNEPPKFYGFPACYDQGGSACARSQSPLAKLPAHASSDGVAVASGLGGSGPSAFVAQNGSTLDAKPTGSDVVRIGLSWRGSGLHEASREVFARGFRRHDPLGAAVGPDGSVYVTLWRSGMIVRFRRRAAAATGSAP